MKTYKWGILGCGHIASVFAKGLQLLDRAELYACGSRDIDKSKEFAETYGFEKAYGSYDELVADPNIDVIYIASPHSHHKEHATLCMKHNKAVLCEKAFALNSSELNDILQVANETKVFLMEAVWPPFQDFSKKADELLNSGKYGKLVNVNSTFSFKGEYDMDNRLFNPKLGGGSLLDIGIYPIIDTMLFVGEPDKIKAIANLSPTGTDSSINFIFGYDNGVQASLSSSFMNKGGVYTDLCCEEATIRLVRKIENIQLVKVIVDDEVVESYSFSPDAKGYHLEAVEVMECLDKGLLESPNVPHSFSKTLMKIMDDIRIDAGIPI